MRRTSWRTAIRPSRSGALSTDVYGSDVTYKGKVQSLGVGTGSAFSLLPAQNSSGNWVKVVQRVPVRVDIELPQGGPTLSAGMSATVSIDTGHTRSLSDLF